MSTLSPGPECGKVNTARKSTVKPPQYLIKGNGDSFTNEKDKNWALPVIQIKDNSSNDILTTRKCLNKSENKTESESSSHTSNIFNIFNDRTKWNKDSSQKRLSDSSGQSTTMILSRQSQWSSQNQRFESLTNESDPESPDKTNSCVSARKSVNPAKIARQQAEEIFKLQQKFAMQDKKLTNINGSIDSHEKTNNDSSDIVILSDSETEMDSADKCKMDTTTEDSKQNLISSSEPSKPLINCLSKPFLDDEKRKALLGPIMNAISKVGLQGKPLMKKDIENEKSENNSKNQEVDNHPDNNCVQIKTESDGLNVESDQKDIADVNTNLATAEMEASLLADDDDKAVEGDDNQEINDDLLNDDEVLNDDEPSSALKSEIKPTPKDDSLKCVEMEASQKEQIAEVPEEEILSTVKPKTLNENENKEHSEILLAENNLQIDSIEVKQTESSDNKNSESQEINDSSLEPKLYSPTPDEKTEEVTSIPVAPSEESADTPNHSSPKKRPLSCSESDSNEIENKKVKLDTDLENKCEKDAVIESNIINNESSDLKMESLDSLEPLETNSELKLTSKESEEVSEIKTDDVEMVEDNALIKIVSIESEQEMELRLNENQNNSESTDSEKIKTESNLELKIANITSEENELLLESDEEVKICDTFVKSDTDSADEIESQKNNNVKEESDDLEKSPKKLKCDEEDQGCSKKELEPLAEEDKIECKNEKIKVDTLKTEFKEENVIKTESEASVLEVANEIETKDDFSKVDVKVKNEPQSSTNDVLDDDGDVKICSPKTERFLTKKTLSSKIKLQLHEFMEDNSANEARALKKRIDDLERIIATWRNTAQELQKQVFELTIRQQRTEKRRPMLNKVQYRNVGIQVTHTRILNTAQQPQPLLPPGSQGAQVNPPGVPQRMTVLSGNQGTGQVIPVSSQAGNTQLTSLLNTPPNPVQSILMSAAGSGQNPRPVASGPNSTGKPIVYQIVSSAPSRFVSSAPVQAVATSIIPATGTTPSVNPVPLVTTSNPSSQYVMVNMTNAPNSVPTSSVAAIRQENQPVSMVSNMPGNQPIVSQQLMPNIAAVRPTGTNMVVCQSKPAGNENLQKQVIDLTNDEDERPNAGNQRAPVVVTGRVPQVVAQAPTSTGLIHTGPPPLISNQQSIRVVGPSSVPATNVRPGQPTTIFVRGPPVSIINQRPTYLVAQNVVQTRQVAPTMAQSGVRVPSPSTLSQYRPQIISPQAIQQNRPILGGPKPPPPLLQPLGAQQVRANQPPSSPQNQNFSNTPTSGSVPNLKRLPPKPSLKISRVDSGIVLSWNMNLSPSYAKIASYQLYAYQEGNTPPNTALWKKVGDVKALPLPMACTLTQFVEGHKYHFAVRAVDVHGRLGPLSDACSIHLTSMQHH